jgi:hypothetical protein
LVTPKYRGFKAYVTEVCQDENMSSLMARAQSQRKNMGRGLTNQGAALVPSAVCFIGIGIELILRGKVGSFSGLTILIANIGGSWLSRANAKRIAAVTPPLAVLVSLIFWLPIGPSSLSLTRLLIDIVSALASLAPYLLFGALVAWVNHYRIKFRR